VMEIAEDSMSSFHERIDAEVLNDLVPSCLLSVREITVLENRAQSIAPTSLASIISAPPVSRSEITWTIRIIQSLPW